MKKILITSFMPFDNRGTNQSQVIANQLRYKEVTHLVLPVTFESSFQILVNHLKDHSYDFILCLGEGPNKVIHLEHIALNIVHARIADNDGRQPQLSAIVEDGPLALESSLPLTQIANQLGKEKALFAHSFHAGTYVCNDLFYRLMELKTKTPRGFIHVPHEMDHEKEALRSMQIILSYLIHRK